MAQDSDHSTGERGDLSQFRKNRFFSGKLMTPRDMEAEQEYHAERLHALSRFVVGSGIVHGLEIRSIGETDDGLEVTIEPGLALDGRGRPIVVEQVTTKSLPRPSANELSLYIEYEEVSLETVPVPNTDDAIDAESTSNRTVEVFELTYRETTEDERPQLPDVEIPSVGSDGLDAETISRQLLERYHDQHRSAMPSETETAVFLGSFERTPDGAWTESTEPAPREFAYDHDLLFATIIDHVTDTDNPHRTPVEREPPDIPDGIGEITDRLDALETELGRVKRDQTALTQYVMRKTLKDRARFFDELADRVAQQTREGSRLAREIATVSRTNGEEICDSEGAYRRHLREILEHLIDLGDHLEGATTEASLERYLKSVSDLQSALENDDPVLELAEIQDRVCEAADSLDVLVDVVPNE
ncbi:hypothetical protein [Natrinema longum]|uniref:Uncharacterized protein n=1 Tax=Natrinema longum TaxID=370324 RepID=A0A8A2UDL3_9EURY|nr:hypothetical protein [Natrinema longum]MBZ6495299.1 hypothetical protein [Natrinema longum]QSW86723.1 hypothetical protein J0X27_07905 [Natrinema longum]